MNRLIDWDRLQRDYMRRIARLIGIWLGTAILFAASANAQEIKLTDYDVPVSQSHRLELTGALSYVESSTNRTRRSSFYDLSTYWQSFYNSLPFAWEVDFDARWTGFTSTSRKSSTSRDASFSGSIRDYATEEGLLFGGVHTDINWRNRVRRPGVAIGLSIGLGRYVDATALARALRIEEFLIAEGILTDHLPKETLLELASLIDREREYKLRYGDTYKVRWYDNMDQAIVSGAMLPDGTIGALGVMRIRDVLEREEVQPRAHGWIVETGVDVAVAHETQSDPGDAWPYAAAAFAWPLGLKHQVSFKGQVAGPTANNFGDFFQIAATLTYSYELTNRIDLVITDTYSNNRRGPDTNQRINRLSLKSTYYVENRVTLSLLGLLEHDSWKSWYERRRWQIESQIGYRIF